jgi:hypothetical protein
MSARAVVALHVAWMAVIVGIALWAGWLFRFEGDRGLLYLDRWTGELVDPVNGPELSVRYSLWKPVRTLTDVEHVKGGSR